MLMKIESEKASGRIEMPEGEKASVTLSPT
jgi:hypothetical protein